MDESKEEISMPVFVPREKHGIPEFCMNLYKSLGYISDDDT